MVRQPADPMSDPALDIVETSVDLAPPKLAPAEIKDFYLNIGGAPDTGTFTWFELCNAPLLTRIRLAGSLLLTPLTLLLMGRSIRVTTRRKVP